MHGLRLRAMNEEKSASENSLRNAQVFSTRRPDTINGSLLPPPLCNLCDNLMTLILTYPGRRASV